ncbi:unnamed protein product [Toxocara canis]|uniref:PDZ domain-containing protein n=1 Tax=Toxocara canis TaxID=6265 RepID=A0A183U8C6_TOXCA|nr:unnamed protein product [Toxocara canis]
MVEQVEKEMRADGILQPGDVLISVNDIKIEDVEHFYRACFLILTISYAISLLISRLFPQVRIELERKVIRSPLNDLRAKMIGLTPKKNCEYFIAHIHRIPGLRLGMSIKVCFLS